MSSVLEQIAERQRISEARRAAEFAEMVTAIVDGEVMPPEFVEATLAELGKTLPDLQTAVSRLQHRRQLVLTIDQAAAESRERAELQRQLDQAEREFAAVQEQHRRRIAPAQARLQQLTFSPAHANAADAERQLRATASPALKERQEKLEGALRIAEHKMKQAREAQKRAQQCAGIESDRARIGGQHYRERAEEHERSAVEHGEAIRALEREMEALNQQLSETLAAMLAP